MAGCVGKTGKRPGIEALFSSSYFQNKKKAGIRSITTKTRAVPFLCMPSVAMSFSQVHVSERLHMPPLKIQVSRWQS